MLIDGEAVTTQTPVATQVLEVNDLQELQRFRDDWDRLLEQTSQASFFQTLDWLTCYWRHFGERQRLRVLLGFEDDRLVGVLPLSERRQGNRLGSVRALGYPLDNWGTRYGPIGPDPVNMLAAGLQWLTSHEQTWDVVDLGWADESTREHSENALASVRLPVHTESADRVSLVDFTTTWETYWSTRTSKHRNNVRRAEKRMQQLGEVTVVHHCREVEPRWDLYDQCETIASLSWQGGSTTGNTLTHEGVRAFLRDVHQEASTRRAAAMHVVFVDDEPVAFAYNYQFAGTVYALRFGYAPHLAAASPGTFLLSEVVRDAFKQNCQWLDLGEGDAAYKQMWRTHEVPTFNVRHYRKHSLLAQALRLKRHWIR